MVANWLSDGGFLGQVASLNDIGISILEDVAPVEPVHVLEAVRRAAASDFAALETADDRARRIVGLLRSIAYEAEFFTEAMRLMAQFATGRDPSNDARAPANVFVSMFHLYLSGTHATALERANLLRWLIDSDMAGASDLALKGLDAMLECNHFSSLLSFEFGSRRRNYGLNPSGDEVRAWFRVALDLAAELDRRPQLSREVRHAVARRFTPLALWTGAIDDVVVLARQFAANGRWVEGWRRAKAASRAAAKVQREPEAARLGELAEALRPADLEDRVVAYVFDDEFALLEPEPDEDAIASVGRARERLEEIRAELGRELAIDKELLDRLLPKLIGQNGPGAAILGFEVGRCIEDPRAFWEKVARQIAVSGTSAAMGSFAFQVLRGIGERCPELADKLLDNALVMPALHHALVAMQWSVASNGYGMKRLMKAAQLPTVPITAFQVLSWGRWAVAVDSGQLRDLLRLVADRDGGVDIALNIFSMRMHGLEHEKQPLAPEDHEVGIYLISRADLTARKHDNIFHLQKIFSKILRPDQDESPVREFCARLRDTFARTSALPAEIGSLVAELGRNFPRIVLDTFVEGNVGDADELNERMLPGWASRGGILGKVDENVMIEWARERPEARLPALAHVILPWIPKEDPQQTQPMEGAGPLTWSSVGLRLIVEASDPLPVLDAYEQRLHPSSWWGSLADILDERVKLIEEFLEHPDIRVRDWAAQARQRFAHHSLRQREADAAEARARDQRFER
jgi:hypothetical protein